MKINKIIFLNSLIISALVQSGIFGFNVDYKNYLRAENDFWKASEFVGGYISTLTVNDIFLGPFFVTFTVSVGLGYFLTKLPKFFFSDNQNKIFVVISVQILLLLSWPLFIGITNAFRQAVATGFIFLLLGLLLEDKKKNWLIILVFFLTIFAHKFGKYYSIIILFSLFFNKLRFSIKISSRVLFLFSIFGCLSTLILFKIFYPSIFYYPDNYVTGIDLLYFFYIFFAFSVLFLFLGYNLNRHDLFLSLVFLKSIVFSLVYVGNSILYERINWLSFIISIFIISSFLSSLTRIRNSILIIIILLTLMCLTFYIQLEDNYYFYQQIKEQII